MNSAPDDSFNTEKFKLPFYYKLKDKKDFNNTLAVLLSYALSEIQKIDLFYTLHALQNVDERVWLDYFVTIQTSLSISNRINLLKCCSFFVKSDAYVDRIQNIYDQLLDETDDERAVFDICFLDTSFFKPLLHSSIHFLRNFNKRLLSHLLERCAVMAKDDDRWLFCAERLAHVRDLTDVEYARLLPLMKQQHLRGRALDILLHSSGERIGAAHELLCENIRFFESADAVHYLELTAEAAERVAGFATGRGPFTCVVELIAHAQCAAEDEAGLRNAQNFARELVCGCFSVRVGERTVTLADVFVFCWQCEDKEPIVREIMTFDKDLCSYGVVTNLLMCLSGVRGETFLRVNERLAERDEVVAALRREMPTEFWDDAAAVEAAVEERLTEL